MQTSLVVSCVIHIVLIMAFDGWLLLKVLKWAMAFEERLAKKQWRKGIHDETSAYDSI